MHLFNVATLVIVIWLVGVEFAVSAFVNPAAWRLDREPQLKMLSRLAFVLGRVMPVWYPMCGVLLGIQTWLHWQTTGGGALLAATAIWAVVSVATIFLLVPLNTRVAKGTPDWQQSHRLWDSRHRVRIVALAVAAILLTYVLVS